MIKNISHIGFAVSDPDRTARLFRELFSADIIKKENPGKGSPEIFAYLAGTWFAFIATTPHESRSDDHVAFNVPEEELNVYAEKLSQMGITHEFSRHGKDARSLYFYDYDNHLFELHTGALEKWLTLQRDSGNLQNHTPAL